MRTRRNTLTSVRGWLALAVVATSLLVTPAAAQADVPSSMVIDGVLETASGVPANGSYKLTLALYATSSSTTPLFTPLAFSNVSVVNGLFQVTFGPVPANVFRDNPTLWLETVVDSEPPLPRRPILTQGYAFHAQTAGTAGGLACSGCVDGSDIAPGAVQSGHITNGAVTSDSVNFNYAGSSTKGGAATNAVHATSADSAATADVASKATDVDCPGCVDATDVSFQFAVGNASGEATKVACSGCVNVSDLDMAALDARYLLKTGGTLTGPLTVQGNVTASSFAGDGANLTNVVGSIQGGNCADGEFMFGISATGQPVCKPQCSPNFTGEVLDGSVNEGVDLRYQYSPTGAGQGFIRANWTSQTDVNTYEIAVGTTPGGTDVKGYTNVGSTPFATVSGLTLAGAWTGTTYYVSVRGVCGNFKTSETTSDGVLIAEKEVWDGSTAGLRSPDALGGYSNGWPTGGINSVYGRHWFESVSIANGTEVNVQGWGKADSVGAGIGASDAKVTNPKDGWLAVYANDITVAGKIRASGRGYGGGGGGASPCGGNHQGGFGGTNGLGGTGGGASSCGTCACGCTGGGGGGGSPFGSGQNYGGSGNMVGGGGGSFGQTACGSYGGDGGANGSGPQPGLAGGSGAVGGSGVTPPVGNSRAGDGGVGEFSAGGGGGSGYNNNGQGGSSAGGGGGGYGGGGGGGNENASGGGGGGTGGANGGSGGGGQPGGNGAGPYGGNGGIAKKCEAGWGDNGGYRSYQGNGDSTSGRELYLGSGGGGGGGDTGNQAAGGGGAAGGGYVLLHAANKLTITSTGYVLANGAGGGGGGRDDNDCRAGGRGGRGAGGGILFESPTIQIDGGIGDRISARGGDADTGIGGTVKLFYDAFTGEKPSKAGRVYDPGAGTYQPAE